MGLGRSSYLRIGGDPSAVSGSGRSGSDSDRLTGVAIRNTPGEPPIPLDKGKGELTILNTPRDRNI